MAATPHVLFTLRGHLFAIRAGHVREVARIPALQPLAEAPRHVAGVVDVRGHLVPVVDLAVRMGYEPAPRDPTQALVVLVRDDAQTAVIVDRVIGVEDVADEDVEPAPDAPAGVAPVPDRVVREVVRVGERVATMLDVEDVLYRARPEDLERPGGELAAPDPRDAEVLRERARRLAEPVDAAEVTHAPSLVLVRLGGDTFAVRAESPLEFVHLGDVAPVPCCPRHIAGHASLRGDVVVVVDVRDLLGLTAPPPGADVTAMLVRAGAGGSLAILVEEVLEVAEGRDLEPMPAAGAGSPFVVAHVRVGDDRVPLLDVDAVAAAPEIIVKQEA